MRACWLKWVGRDWSISADYIWLNYSGANNGVGDVPLGDLDLTPGLIERARAERGDALLA